MNAVSVVYLCVAMYNCRRALSDDRPGVVAGLQTVAGLCISALLVSPAVVFLLLDSRSTRHYSPIAHYLGCMPATLAPALCLLILTLALPALLAFGIALWVWRSITANERLAFQIKNTDVSLQSVNGTTSSIASADNRVAEIAEAKLPEEAMPRYTDAKAISNSTADESANIVSGINNGNCPNIPRVFLQCSLSNESSNSQNSQNSQSSAGSSNRDFFKKIGKSANKDGIKQSKEANKKNQKDASKNFPNGTGVKHEKATRQIGKTKNNPKSNPKIGKFLLVDNSLDSICHSIDNVSVDEEDIQNGLNALDEAIKDDNISVQLNEPLIPFGYSENNSNANDASSSCTSSRTGSSYSSSSNDSNTCNSSSNDSSICNYDQQLGNSNAGLVADEEVRDIQPNNDDVDESCSPSQWSNEGVSSSSQISENAALFDCRTEIENDSSLNSSSMPPLINENEELLENVVEEQYLVNKDNQQDLLTPDDDNQQDPPMPDDDNSCKSYDREDSYPSDNIISPDTVQNSLEWNKPQLDVNEHKTVDSSPKSPSKSILRKPSQARKQQNRVKFCAEVIGDISGRLLRKPTAFSRGAKSNKLVRSEALDDSTNSMDGCSTNSVEENSQSQYSNELADIKNTAGSVNGCVTNGSSLTPFNNNTDVTNESNMNSITDCLNDNNNKASELAKSTGNGCLNHNKKSVTCQAKSDGLLITESSSLDSRSVHNNISAVTQATSRPAGQSETKSQEQKSSGGQSPANRVSDVHNTISNLCLQEARRQRQTLALLLVILVLYVLLLLPCHLIDIYLTFNSLNSTAVITTQISIVFFWVSLNVGIVSPLIFIAGDQNFGCTCDK